MIKALCVDLDGTLLTSAREITATTLKALLACRQREIRVFPVTARPPRLTRMLSLTGPAAALFAEGGVYYNGGCVMAGDEKIYHCLSKQAASELASLCAAHDPAPFALQLVDEQHAFKSPLPKTEYTRWGITEADIVPWNAALAGNIVKFVALGAPEAMVPLAEAIDHRVADTALYLSDGQTCIQLTSSNARKAKGLQDLLGKWAISPDEATVFGDDVNDMEMLRAFPNSIAMGNAPEPVRRSAKHVTRSNDEEGIVYALEHILKVFSR
jgi:Cof subfamily protein (haloacid dehalogenase superfamily)